MYNKQTKYFNVWRFWYPLKWLKGWAWLCNMKDHVSPQLTYWTLSNLPLHGIEYRLSDKTNNFSFILIYTFYLLRLLYSFIQLCIFLILMCFIKFHAKILLTFWQRQIINKLLFITPPFFVCDIRTGATQMLHIYLHNLFSVHIF